MALPSPTILALWNEQPPLFNPADDRERLFLRFYPQPDPQAPLMVVFPGGGYNVCAEAEGMAAVEFYHDAGYATVYVQYRTQLHSARMPLGKGPLLDAVQAMNRLHESDLAFDRNRVAAVGFSAGGHLLGSLLIHGPAVETPPTLLPRAVILSYPVVSSGRYRHGGSLHNLCGDDESNPDREFFSLEKQVRPGLPPFFLWHTSEDKAVPAQNTLFFAQALGEAGVPYELHIFPRGPHGIFMGSEDYPETKIWPSLSLTWLKWQGVA